MADHIPQWRRRKEIRECLGEALRNIKHLADEDTATEGDMIARGLIQSALMLVPRAQGPRTQVTTVRTVRVFEGPEDEQGHLIKQETEMRTLNGEGDG